MRAAALVAVQLAGALGEQQHGVGGGAQRVGDRVAVLERERGPQLVADLGEQDVAARDAAGVERGQPQRRAAASSWRAWRIRSGALVTGISLRCVSWLNMTP